MSAQGAPLWNGNVPVAVGGAARVVSLPYTETHESTNTSRNPQFETVSAQSAQGGSSSTGVTETTVVGETTSGLGSEEQQQRPYVVGDKTVLGWSGDGYLEGGAGKGSRNPWGLGALSFCLVVFAATAVLVGGITAGVTVGVLNGRVKDWRNRYSSLLQQSNLTTGTIEGFPISDVSISTFTETACTFTTTELNISPSAVVTETLVVTQTLQTDVYSINKPPTLTASSDATITVTTDSSLTGTNLFTGVPNCVLFDTCSGLAGN
ncbi:hypothetical protein ABW19_dt0206001 [Dactylella cylindrospora]|nr:hypothetical protein ABW19_dt0206001 [Dactylella cylindrospora]